MRLKTPQWWYARPEGSGRLLRAILRPAGALYAAAGRRRRRRTRPYDPGIPVVCVGNLTLGGSGKTPVARALAERLLARGLRAAVVSRGYGGRLAGPLRVDPDRHGASEVGDEPLMLARALEVWIGRRRADAARAARADGAQALVLDDGHQNPTVRKGLSLVVVDADGSDGRSPFGDGDVFPAGPLREPLAEGLARADALVLMGPGEVDPGLGGLLRDRRVLRARLALVGPPPGGPLVGFAGVAKPWRVEAAWRRAGLDLRDFAGFADHHLYRRRDLDFLRRRAADFGARLVTTEKDHVRLPPEFRRDVLVLEVAAEFEDEAAVTALLDLALRRTGNPEGGA